MKLNKFLAVALASMAMFSCSNNDELENGSLSNEEKTVVLKLEGIQSAKTRSTDEPTETSGEHTITVNEVAILFYDESADKVLQAETVKSTDADWNVLTGTGKEYTKVNASVDKVMIIGNADTELAALCTVGNSPKAIRAHQYSLAKENEAGTGTDKTTKGNVSLYGDAQITLESSASGDTDAKHKADVNLNPLVARFEIKSVGCEFDANPKYAKLVLKGIGLVDYYSQATFLAQATDGIITTTATDKKERTDDNTTGTETNAIYDPESSTTITGEGSYRFCNDSNPAWNWSYDVLTADNEITATASTTQKFKDQTPKEYTFAYNFFPQDGAYEPHHTPNICVWVEAYTAGEPSTPDPNHTIVTSTMQKGGSPLAPKAGEIYQLDYIFNEEHIDKWVSNITVTVKVTVAQWTITEVTPDFGN